jgi:hypothetical protein
MKQKRDALQGECRQGASAFGEGMRPHPRSTVIGIGGLVVSLGLLASCAASVPAVAQASPGVVVSDRVREEKACLRVSVGQNDKGYVLLPFEIDQETYRRCMEARGYPVTPRGESMQGKRS